ncbi:MULTISPECIES: low affinity iron permease family protein [Brucella]|jgi:low affinity Fe/Cu permease|uniref:Low affinity iron permease family protein n=1 Tax=Brucella lupini TaxID=255457 RepID=A0A256GGN4_9HYPH|nr:MULTISPECIES: low affinity iron permease family protein [Brucella]OYR26046.1 low affinity iron permease family protein [Brucella lupini]
MSVKSQDGQGPSCIQNSQKRVSFGLQAKLDALSHALKNAREGVVAIEHLPLKELERLRDEIEKNMQGNQQEFAVIFRTRVMSN